MAASKAVLSTQAAVIGALLIHPEICGELFAETSARDLVTADYRDVYEAARALLLEDKPADPVTVLDRMGGGPETRKFLLEMMDITPSAANWREYAKLLREQARLYRLQQAGKRLMRSGTLDEARSVLSDAQQDGSDMEGGNVVSISQGTVDFLKRQSEPVRYINFGVGRLDRQLYASLGDFIVIGGRPSAGKTLFSVQLADTLSRKYRVGYFSLETSPEKIFDRFFAQAVPLDFSDVKRHSLSREDYEALIYQKRRFLEQHLDVIRAGGYTAEVGAVSRALHTLAQRHNVLVIALAQLSRAPKGMRVDPTLSDLRESGQIEQDADIVMLLSLKIPDTDDEDNGDRLLQIVKNKEGRTGKFCLAFDGRHQQLVERMGGQEK